MGDPHMERKYGWLGQQVMIWVPSWVNVLEWMMAVVGQTVVEEDVENVYWWRTLRLLMLIGRWLWWKKIDAHLNLPLVGTVSWIWTLQLLGMIICSSQQRIFVDKVTPTFLQVNHLPAEVGIHMNLAPTFIATVLSFPTQHQKSKCSEKGANCLLHGVGNLDLRKI